MCVGILRRTIVRGPAVRVCFDVLAVGLLVALTFEGGLFFVPALLSLMLLDASGRTLRRAAAR